MNPKLAFLVDIARTAFDDRPLFADVRLPRPPDTGQTGSTDPFVTVPALWTKNGFKPQWKNLAALASSVESEDKIGWWNNVLTTLSIPLGMFVFKDKYLLSSRTASGQTEIQELTKDELAPELERQNRALFSPTSLAHLRRGQLSLADLEETITPESFSFHTRHNAQLAQSLEDAVRGALLAELEHERTADRKDQRSKGESRSIYDAVLIVAIAFLAARILEDKGFFGSDQMPTDDPQALLKRTLSKTNGFFKKALNEELPLLSTRALQELAVQLGSRAIFTLVDHHQVGILYERALRAPLLMEELIDRPDIKSALLSLQQHYTPVAVADRMLELLPLERLRPEDRRVFDPAAGSGSLLLAATLRLAAMTDLPQDDQSYRSYLSSHVAGNDLDVNANLLTRLRYTLSQESDGVALPSPDYFGNRDFESYTHDTLPTKARVIVANPPFGEEGNVQRAARFVNLLTEWLTDGDQFAVVLPQSFLSGSTHGIADARRKLAKRCHVFETWQLPEGVIGLAARQAVCVVLGRMGKAKSARSMVRALLSGAMTDTAREEAFLGQAWVTELDEASGTWGGVLAPPITIANPTVELSKLYYVFSGVTPDKRFPPVSELEEGVDGKRYWRLGWREAGRVWADPQRVIPEERFIRYGKTYLKKPSLQNEDLYDQPKIMIGRSVNRNARDPLAACFDTEGFCPNNDVYCVCTLGSKSKEVDLESSPVGWQELTNDGKLLWLLGILTSEVACELSLGGRDARHLDSTSFRKLPLPAEVDRRIIFVAEQMLNRDQRREALPSFDPLRIELNHLVEASYGNPERMKLHRTGVAPELAAWLSERREPTVKVTGQVLEVSRAKGQALLFLEGISDQNEHAWLPLPLELPGWALDGEVFMADLSENIQTFAQLAERPWALRNFRHTPRPYLTIEELKQRFASLQHG